MKNSKSELDRVLNTLEYCSHWISLSSLLAKCSPKQPFLKIRKFPQQNFARKHEITINHLYFQKLYLICIAIEFKARLDISENYYQENGLIFGVYEFYLGNGQKATKYGGIKMKEELDIDDGYESFYTIVKQCSQNNFQYVNNLNFNPQDEYIQWSQSLSLIFSQNPQIQPFQFVQQIQKLALAEHYVYNVKLKNVMLLPFVLSEYQNVERMRVLMKNQKLILDEVLYEKGDPTDLMFKFQGMLKQIYGGLERRGKIYDLALYFVQPPKNKSKQINQLKIQCKFCITLSPSRNRNVISEQQNDHQDMKGPKTHSKMQTKSESSSSSPLSDNKIFVNFTWELYLDSKCYRLKVQCYNNRKVEQMYFDDLLKFWTKLQNSEQFHDLIGIDKYSIPHYDKKLEGNSTQVVFLNYISGCLPTNTMPQIDKIVSLAVAMDQIVQICERKGLQHEDPSNFQILPYMVSHTKQRFSRALTEVQRNKRQIAKDSTNMNQ